MILKNVLTVDPINGERVATIEIDSGRIVSLKESFDVTSDQIVMPGFFDPHTHAAIGIDTMSLNEHKLREWEHFLYSQGVTSFLPTTVSADHEAIVSAGSFLEQYIEQHETTSVKGVHYEGPFINPSRKGAQNPSFIREASVEEIGSLPLKSCRLITMAPELPGFKQAIRFLAKKDVVISAGHTDATYEEMKEAYSLGCKRMTHFPNGMRGLHHREIGCVGAGIALPMSLELIVDGIHSAPDFVKLVYSLKGPEKIILITDSMSAAGLDDGSYDLGGLDVEVRRGRATLRDGTLAGSTLLFSAAVRNFREFTDCTLIELSRVSSYNALSEVGIPDRGRVMEGFVADLVVMNKELEVLKTIMSGRVVYDAA
ncbi:MAG TPA: N-acetylglucosamine-6-phosphate deacetylase [Kosmotogaceae bacterium]|nr:MAG: N-acetylglucosamine-6-phosphate deacetylase [Thermotogales bacterium 46_20]HAA85161.1 N-acetylglucosamine-6-phosphate deacetylase [Kosmotogaceae bacterium]